MSWLRSLYENRFRRRGGADPADQEPILDETGAPVLVVVAGELVGYRAKGGGIFRPPGWRPRESEPDTVWVLTPGRGWRREWREPPI